MSNSGIDSMPRPMRRKISTTGYRLFVILQLLTQGPISKEEILREMNGSQGIGSVSEDTIRLDINTLKSAGFEIGISGKGGGYKYSLNWNPLKINFDRSELMILKQAKNAALELCSWEYIANLYEVFSKIAKFTQDEQVASDFMNFGYFSNVDFNMLKELETYCKNRNSVQIVYYSPNSGEKVIDITCWRIIYQRDSGKLYLWGEIKDKSDFAYLRVDNILKVVGNDFTKHAPSKPQKTCKYRLRHAIGDKFKLDEGERISANTSEYLEIECPVYSEFYFIQRILGFGRHCFWVENDTLRLKILDKLKRARELYV